MIASLVPPPAQLSDAAEGLRTDVRRFLAQEVAEGGFVPGVDTWLAGWDPDFSRRLAARGWVGMTIPTEYGGHGRSALDRYVVVEELLAAGAPVAAHWIADRQIAPSLLRYGTEEQKRHYLPGIAAGKVFFGIGMSEPDAGSDLAAVRTRAERVEGGWSVTGTKLWTSGAHHSHAFFALVRTGAPERSADGRVNRHTGLSQLIVDLRSPGVQIRPIRLMTGAHHFNEVVLDAVFVPDTRVLGDVGQGWHQVTSELAYERSGPERFLSTFYLLVVMTADLQRRRAVGDLPDAELRELGSLVARVSTFRQLSLAVAGSLSSGAPAEVAAALVKNLGTRFEGDLVEVARLTLGTEPDPTATTGVARLLSDALLHMPGFTLRGGTNEVLKGVIARGMGLR